MSKLYDDPEEPEVTEPDEYPYPEEVDWDEEDEEEYWPFEEQCRTL